MDPVSIGLAVVLLMLSGLFSGLNLGLMSFAEDDLMVIIRGSEDAREVAHAKRILPLRRKGNLLLCTLLLGNTLVNALIAVLLTSMTSGLYASLITTMLIVIFGEIGPQSVCSRYALAIGSRAVPLVWLFVALTFLIAYPTSLLLDSLLGREVSAVYTKTELLSLIELNVHDEEHAKQSGLTVEDGKLLKGALTFRKRVVSTAMTPLDATFVLPLSAKMDTETVQRLLAKGHTRMPVYDEASKGTVRGPSGSVAKGNIIGLLFAKDLVGIGFERALPLADVLEAFNGAARVNRVPASALVGDAYDLCRSTRSHMIIVVEDNVKNSKSYDMSKAPAVGIITLEDIIEEIIQEEIVDEDDVLEDAAAASFHIKRQPSLNIKRYDPSLLVRKFSSNGPSSSSSRSGSRPKGRAPRPKSSKKYEDADVS